MIDSLSSCWRWYLRRAAPFLLCWPIVQHRRQVHLACLCAASRPVLLLPFPRSSPQSCRASQNARCGDRARKPAMGRVPRWVRARRNCLDEWHSRYTPGSSHELANTNEEKREKMVARWIRALLCCAARLSSRRAKPNVPWRGGDRRDCLRTGPAGRTARTYSKFCFKGSAIVSQYKKVTATLAVLHHACVVRKLLQATLGKAY